MQRSSHFTAARFENRTVPATLNEEEHTVTVALTEPGDDGGTYTCHNTKDLFTQEDLAGHTGLVRRKYIGNPKNRAFRCLVTEGVKAYVEHERPRWQGTHISPDNTRPVDILEEGHQPPLDGHRTSAHNADDLALIIDDPPPEAPPPAPPHAPPPDPTTIIIHNAIRGADAHSGSLQAGAPRRTPYGEGGVHSLVHFGYNTLTLNNCAFAAWRDDTDPDTVHCLVHVANGDDETFLQAPLSHLFPQLITQHINPALARPSELLDHCPRYIYLFASKRHDTALYFCPPITLGQLIQGNGWHTPYENVVTVAPNWHRPEDTAIVRKIFTLLIEEAVMIDEDARVEARDTLTAQVAVMLEQEEQQYQADRRRRSGTV